MKRLNQVHKKKIFDDLSFIDFISLTTDFWCDHSSRSYICITGHWFTDEMDLKSKVLIFTPFLDRHTSENISFELDKHLNSLNISDKTTTITCDGASNLKAALNKLDNRIKRLHCLAHKIHLIICNGLGLWVKKKNRGQIVSSGEWSDTNNDTFSQRISI